MKIAILSDTHWGIRGDSTAFLDYQKIFLDNVFFPYLREHGITQIILPGDLVDRRKYINFNTARRMREDFLDPIRREFVMCVVAGNHDIYSRNTSEVNALDELIGNDDRIPFFTKPQETSIDGTAILLVPWINDENQVATLETIKNTKAQICIGHLELKGFEMQKGHVADHGMDAALFDKFDLVISGHYHTRSTKGNITYVGTPFQMNWGDWGEKRGFHILDTETRELEFVENPYSLFSKYVYNDENLDQEALTKQLDNEHFEGVYVKLIVEKKTNPYLLDLAISYIESKGPLDLKVVEAQEIFSRDYEYVPNTEIDDTSTLLKRYIKDAGVTDAERLENLMLELLAEAQANAV